MAAGSPASRLFASGALLWALVPLAAGAATRAAPAPPRSAPGDKTGKKKDERPPPPPHPRGRTPPPRGFRGPLGRPSALGRRHPGPRRPGDLAEDFARRVVAARAESGTATIFLGPASRRRQHRVQGRE